MKPRISFQGEPGANSHLACAEARPDHEPLPCPTFEDAFSAVSEGAADLAMIPIENSLAGRVADIHHLLPHSGLHIVGEHFLPIRFQLMGIRGARPDGLKAVYSHIHALGQCRAIIRRLNLTAMVTGDTAGAAREVAEAGDPARAALAPPLAADLYGLDILARDVADSQDNTTRFVILAKAPNWAGADERPVTSFVFRVRNVPAALYKAMGGFATNGVNMTKLESYQLDGTFTATQFYAEIEGHPENPMVKLALEELQFFSSALSILGVYPGAPFRWAAQAR